MEISKICKYITSRIDSASLNVDNYISTENMMQNRGGVISASKVPKENAIEFKPGDILVSNIRPYFKKIWFADRYGGCSSDVLCIRALEGTDSVYLYYLLSQDTFFDHVMSGAKGCKMPRGDKNQIMRWEVDLPDIKEQKRIGQMLKSIDDKILLNNRINHNLEEQAQALYKSWFVDFEPFKGGKFIQSRVGLIPETWAIQRICDLPLYISDYVSNGSFASLKENVTLYETPNYAQFIRNTDLKCRQFSVWVDQKSYEYLAKSKLEGGEIIISNVGDVGSVHICPQLNTPMTLGNNVIMIKPLDNIYKYFIYMTFKWFHGKDLIKGITGGSAMPKFNKTDFKSLNLLVPDYSTLCKFNSLVSNLFENTISLNSSNQRLSEIRDTLLPKLMSGELKINDLTC